MLAPVTTTGKVCVRLRAAGMTDLPFVLSLAPGLAEFGLLPWRRPLHVVEAERRALERALRTGAPDAPVLLAEDTDGSPLGFAYLETQTDFFTGRPHAHVSVLAVADAAQGRGVGRALLEAAEDLFLRVLLFLFGFGIRRGWFVGGRRLRISLGRFLAR